MCGRYTLDVSSAELGRMLEADVAAEWTASWNIKPTQRVPAFFETITDDGEITRKGEIARWSLLPPWAESTKLKFPTFNARSEGPASKNTWRGPIKHSRAILPATGYYEWKTEGKTKTPNYIHLPDDPLLFAGLYSWWRPKGSDDAWTLTTTIVTRPSTGDVAELHDRAPVILPPDFVDEWVDAGTEGDQTLVDAAVAASTPQLEQLEFHEVAKLTGDGPELVKPSS
ncbi:SOS response-associated peptidase [Brevibacterium aurantiacum]|uniref:Abasic site processing protein n=1 Tax=Brevibacterium aurantiacum TaxID=273384 RepID=A0A556C4P4_BREAU|nr:SOS response-associated peptidase [Brevibacterium aurantiacum]TSI12424.1 SOS response-associated peptidase [Brevibacterium aurantiacum]